MLDFGALPPEINSGRMYLGPGSGPMLAAATAWDALGRELSITATGYASVLSELTDHDWSGPSSAALTKAATPYLAWLHSAAAHADQAAEQARAAAAAYELAFAMTVPPPVIAANRALLLALIATNFFGQNTPAIAATEAHYAQMWLQDATAMYGYAGSSAAASRLTPFTEPPQTSNPAGLAAQSSAVTHAAANAVGSQHTALAQPSTATGVTHQVGNAASAPVSPLSLVDIVEHVPNVTNTVLSTSNAVTSGRGNLAQYARMAFQETQPPPGSGEIPEQTPIKLAGSGVAVGMGRAVPIGTLSAPPQWATAAPEIRTVALGLPAATSASGPAAADIPLAPGSVFSQSVLGTLTRHGPDIPRTKTKPIIVRSPAAG